MSLLGFLISAAITGLIIGALARLAVPGPNPMSIAMTILVGVGGAILGGLVGQLLGLTGGIIIVLQILAAAAIVYFMQRRPNRVL